MMMTGWDDRCEGWLILGWGQERAGSELGLGL